jgi:hypothetical protein
VGHTLYPVRQFLVYHSRLVLGAASAPGHLYHDSAVASLRLFGFHNSLVAADSHYLVPHLRYTRPRRYNPAHIRWHARHSHIPAGIAPGLVEDIAVVTAGSPVVDETAEQSRCRASAAGGSKIGRTPY